MNVKSLKTGPNHPKPTCSCNSWLDHWEKNRGLTAGHCRACRLDKPHSSLLGGHVIKVDSSDQKWYIVPLCSSCNNKDPFVFSLYNSDDLISADSSQCKTKK